MILLHVFSLLALLLSSFLASGRLARRLGFCAASEPLAAAIAGLTLWIAWPVTAALLVAGVAMLSGMALVRLPIIAALSVAGALIVLALGESRGEFHPVLSVPILRAGLRRAWPGRAIFLLVVLPAAGLHAFLLLAAMFRPPMASDGIYYHLPLMGQWLRAGQLLMVPGVWAYCMPGNGEVWQMFFATVGFERIIEPSMLPAGVLCALVVAGLSRALGASIRAAVICASLVLVSPMVALQSYGSYVDLFSASFLLGSCYWILRLARCGSDANQARGAATLAGLSFGMAMGTRLMVLGWGGVVAIALLLAVRTVCRGRRTEHVSRDTTREGTARRRGLPTQLSLLSYFCVGALICSAFWYIRNGLQTGWPLYPVSINLFGHQLGTGFSTPELCADLPVRDWTLLKYPWLESKKHGYSYSVDNGLGIVFAACALPGVLYLLARRARWGRRRLRFADGVVLLFIGVGVVLFVEVFFAYARYALPMWVMAFAAAGPLWSLLVRYRWKTGLVLLGSATWLSAAMIALWPAKNLLSHLQEGDLSRTAWYELPKSLEGLPAGTVILNVSNGPVNYALFGEQWQHEVIDTFMAKHYGLNTPLRRTELDARGVEIVVARDVDKPAELFGSDVCFEELREDVLKRGVDDRARSRAYRIVRPAMDRNLAQALAR